MLEAYGLDYTAITATEWHKISFTAEGLGRPSCKQRTNLKRNNSADYSWGDKKELRHVQPPLLPALRLRAIDFGTSDISGFA